ncbi:MAG TPA: type II toxin-antitoxin system VapC family toxin [Anaeromyxobacteraceae bacterium]|nr:type II toxin-antitoxin system VapC family toxin [Anaeromyxobacteraceae bacterium]
MIVPDVNLLVYAHAAQAPFHATARAWWERTVRSGDPIGLPWAVSLGFLRLMTHPAVLTTPMRPEEALPLVESWYERPNVFVLDPGPRHLAVLGSLLRAAGVAGALTTDAHLAALAIEHGCELHSNDADFGRFSGLRWVNPLV